MTRPVTHECPHLPDLLPDEKFKECVEWPEKGTGSHLVNSNKPFRDMLRLPSPRPSRSVFSWTLTGHQSTLVVQFENIVEILQFEIRSYLTSRPFVSVFLIRANGKIQTWNSSNLDMQIKRQPDVMSMEFAETWFLGDSITRDFHWDTQSLLSRRCFMKYVAAGIDLITSNIGMEHSPCFKWCETEWERIMHVDRRKRNPTNFCIPTPGI